MAGQATAEPLAAEHCTIRFNLQDVAEAPSLGTEEQRF
jgi:hypothetical protein